MKIEPFENQLTNNICKSIETEQSRWKQDIKQDFLQKKSWIRDDSAVIDMSFDLAGGSIKYRISIYLSNNPNKIYITDPNNIEKIRNSLKIFDKKIRDNSIKDVLHKFGVYSRKEKLNQLKNI